jgi:hypothetical protein
VERLIGLYESILSKTYLYGLAALLTLALAGSPWGPSLDNKDLSECFALLNQLKPAPGSECYVTHTSETDYILSFYRPREWRRIDVVPPGIKLDVLLFSRDPARAVPGPPPTRGYRLRRVSGETRPLAGEGAVPRNAWVFWYPDFTSLGVNASGQNAYVQRSGCPALPQHARYQIKSEIYSYLQCYIFSPGDGADSGKVAEVAREGLRRFGGRAVVFVPEKIDDR